jgi:hypothetical protein
MRAWAFHRNSVAGEILVSAAISATGSPPRSRRQTWRRTDEGYLIGTVTS